MISRKFPYPFQNVFVLPNQQIYISELPWYRLVHLIEIERGVKEERMRFLIDLGRDTKFISEFSTGGTQIWYLLGFGCVWLQRPETIPFSKKGTFPAFQGW